MYTVSDRALQKVLLFLSCFIGVSARLRLVVCSFLKQKAPLLHQNLLEVCAFFSTFFLSYNYVHVYTLQCW